VSFNRIFLKKLFYEIPINQTFRFLPSTANIRKYGLHKLMDESEDFKRKKLALAPFAEKNDLQTAQSLPNIVGSIDPKVIKDGQKVNDPLDLNPGQ
jgi:hypothetical protein